MQQLWRMLVERESVRRAPFEAVVYLRPDLVHVQGEQRKQYVVHTTYKVDGGEYA